MEGQKDERTVCSRVVRQSIIDDYVTKHPAMGDKPNSLLTLGDSLRRTERCLHNGDIAS